LSPIDSHEAKKTEKKFNKSETGVVGTKSLKKKNASDSVMSNKVYKHIPSITAFENHNIFDDKFSFLTEVEE
jgi:hypothetical protein